MPLVPLVPLEANVIETAPGREFIAPSGLRERPPDAWVPIPATIRPSSFPTPLALEEATCLLLTRNETHPLVEGSELLLQGLVAGLFRFRWEAVDARGISAAPLRKALKVALDGAPLRIGLITDVRGGVWGYVARESVPCLAGNRIDSLASLRSAVGATQVSSARAAALLQAIRAPLHSEGRWKSTIAWMALVDRVLARLGTPGSVDVTQDVRSLGPFRVTVGPHPEDTTSVQRDLYLLSLAPGYVNRLARFLSASVRRPSDREGAPDRLLLRVGDETVATLRIVSGHTESPIDLGEGLADEIADTVPPRAPEIAALSSSELLANDLSNHLRVLKERCGSLTEALEQKPYLLSDAGRVVALHAPELVGESAPVAYSPAFSTHCRKRGANLRLPSTELAQAVSAGRAFLLQPRPDASDPRVAVFVEDGPGGSETARSAVGDLSSLGVALWLAFTDARYFDRMGFVDKNGEVLFDTSHVDFPLTSSEYAQSWFGRPESRAAAHRLATLQRFLASYERSDGSLGALLALAARRFVGRLLQNEAAADGLRRPGAGHPGVRRKGEESLTLAAYGAAEIVRDAYLDSAEDRQPPRIGPT